MKAIAIVPGTPIARLVERPEPSIGAPDEVKLRVVRVGICGTDREEASGGRARAPDDGTELVIGHEMLGQVVEVGSGVSRVRPGDYAVFTVRRGCGRCEPCKMDRPDLCRTGDFRERGIWGLDGYQAEYVVDREPYAVAVPPGLEAEGVLTEPLSVVEKALDDAARLQWARGPRARRRRPRRGVDRRCLVTGLGPIGLLTATLLRLRGADVHGLDIVDATGPRPRWLARIGGQYVDGREVPPARLRDVLGSMDLIVEASGVPWVAAELPQALAPGGICVLAGIPPGQAETPVGRAGVLRRLVLDNLLVVGSVSASPEHYRMAVADLLRARRRWGGHLMRLVTRRRPFTDFGALLREHPAEEIKAVLEWSSALPPGA